MVKKIHFIVSLLCLWTISLSAQVLIEGTVLFNNQPVEGASIYLNNTSVGTTSQTDGTFTLEIKEGIYQLIVSYIGYKKIEYQLDTSTYNKPFIFLLTEEEFALDEVVITKKRYGPDRVYHLNSFERAFIGTSKFSKQCTIQNPDALFFSYDLSSNHLTAEAYEPLLIENKALGYIIRYELKHFSLQDNYAEYLGYSYFTELKDKKQKQKRWRKNRLKAYHGSQIHFYKSVLANTLKEEGFIVHQFVRKETTASGSENANNTALKKIDGNINPMEFAANIFKRPETRQYADYLYKSDIPRSDIVSIEGETTYLQFKDNISVIYTKEKEELAYLLNTGEERKLLPQTSNVIPLIEKTGIESTGTLSNPLAVIYEGYWSFEKFANALPLDYEPITE